MGPGAPAEATDWLRRNSQPGDQAETVDRLFLLRYHDSLRRPHRHLRRLHRGGARIVQAWVEFVGRAPAGMRFLERTVNGQPDLVAADDSRVMTVFAFEVADDRIRSI